MVVYSNGTWNFYQYFRITVVTTLICGTKKLYTQTWNYIPAMIQYKFCPNGHDRQIEDQQCLQQNWIFFLQLRVYDCYVRLGPMNGIWVTRISTTPHIGKFNCRCSILVEPTTELAQFVSHWNETSMESNQRICTTSTSSKSTFAKVQSVWISTMPPPLNLNATGHELKNNHRLESPHTTCSIWTLGPVVGLLLYYTKYNFFFLFLSMSACDLG